MGRREIKAIGIVQVSRASTGSTCVAVLPDDLIGPRIDHDDPVVVIVVGKDIPVGERQSERRLIECVSALGGISPFQASMEIEHFDGARMDVVGAQKETRLDLVVSEG